MPQLDELATTAAVLHPDKYSSRTDSEGGRGAAGSALRKKFLFRILFDIFIYDYTIFCA